MIKPKKHIFEVVERRVVENTFLVRADEAEDAADYVTEKVGKYVDRMKSEEVDSEIIKVMYLEENKG